MSENEHKDFIRRLEKAINDPRLREALDRSAATYRKQREEVMADLDFDAYREKVREVKERNLAKLPALLEKFKQEAEKLGAVVVEAKDAEELNRYVLDLARKRGVKLAVKSKSMVTEEIELNQVLAEAGIRVVETDLGEWIVQLAGEKPSHFVTPAIHKTKEQVAELLSQVVGKPLPPDIPKLVQVAREELRQAFIDADMGITGANLAIAESGTLVLVTNEGNGRLVSSLPPIHVAVMGIEKLVESLEDAVPILKMLGSSATGQKLTSYTTLITGPSRTADIEKQLTLGVHGPKELHIIFLDNGRRELLDDPEFREALYCIKCSACLNLCPVFMEVGGHVFGHVYHGGIGTILTAFLNDLSAAKELSQICTTCRQCADICPAKIDIPKLTLALRGRLVQAEGLPLIKALALRGLIKHPVTFRLAMRAAACGQWPVTRGKPMIDNLPLFFSRFTEWRALPALASQPLRKRMKDKKTAGDQPCTTMVQGQPKLKVAFFAGCLIDFIYPKIGEAIQEVLAKQGIEMIFPPGQACCGIPATYLGDRETGADLARKNIAALEEEPADLVVTACPTCYEALVQSFVELLQDDEAWAARARALAERTRDFSQLMAELLPEGQIQAEADAPCITYHDPCHLKRGAGIWRQPRQVLTQRGFRLTEMEDSDRCCGFAGSFSLSFPQISRRILERKLANIEETQADLVATDCPGCIMQIRGGLTKSGSRIKVCHTAELLAQSLEPKPPAPIDRGGRLIRESWRVET